MRQPTCIALPLLLCLMVVYCVGGCLAADPATQPRCVFDEVMNKSHTLPMVVVRELPRKGQGVIQAYTVATDDENSDWEPIRIMVSMEDLKSESKYCTIAGEYKPDFEGADKECSVDTILTAKKNATLTSELLPVAVKLHAERLLVQRTSAPWMVPDFTQSSHCQYFTVPSSHRTVGVSAADTVLYVAVGSGEETWAIPCAVGESGRATAVAMHVTARSISVVIHATRIAAHAMAHALGFSAEEMKRQNMLLEVDGVRGSIAPVTMVKSSATLDEAKKHYNCNSMKGMELQAGSSGEVEAHWSVRNAKDELMGPLGENIALYYTTLTMAFFNDLGYYKVAWDMAERMSWGKKTGCSFLNEQCSARSPANYPGMFCKKGSESLRCSSDRHSMGPCGSDVGNKNAVPPEACLTYFVDFDATPPRGHLCTIKESGTSPGSIVGSGSWCLDGDSLEAKNEDGGVWQSNLLAVCAQVSCRDGSLFVKYLGSKDFVHCPAGKSIKPKSQYFRGSGTIRCPRYEEVCTIAANGSSLAPVNSTGDSAAITAVTGFMGHLMLSVLAAIAAVVISA